MSCLLNCDFEFAITGIMIAVFYFAALTMVLYAVMLALGRVLAWLFVTRRSRGA